MRYRAVPIIAMSIGMQMAVARGAVNSPNTSAMQSIVDAEGGLRECQLTHATLDTMSSYTVRTRSIFDADRPVLLLSLHDAVAKVLCSETTACNVQAEYTDVLDVDHANASSRKR